MNFIVDMNLSPRWVEFLVSCGFGAAHWSDLGLSGAPDSEIMRYARRHAAIVLTNDLDFGAILVATGADKPSVIQIRSEQLNPDLIGSEVVAAIRQMSSELESGALITIDQERVRIRIFSLHLKS